MKIYKKTPYFDLTETAFTLQQKMRWTHEEVSLTDDQLDWLEFSEEEKRQIEKIFQFFTQSDMEVAESYGSSLVDIYPDDYSIRHMFAAFENQEAVHMRAYGALLDTYGFPAETYEAFVKDPVLSEKYALIENFRKRLNEAVRNDDLKEKAICSLFFSTYMEGVSLFAMFAILTSYGLNNRLRGMNQIVAWSIRDESLHVASILKLNALCFDKTIYKKALDEFERETLPEIIPGDIAYMKDVYESGSGPGNLDAATMERFIEWTAGVRMAQAKADLYAEPFVLKESDCPIPWFLDSLELEHANFFVTSPSQYKRLDFGEFVIPEYV